MSLLGYLAQAENCNEKIFLRKTTSPRKQLLDYLCTKSCKKMYVDKTDGSSKHIGYIAGGNWWRILEVHSWEGKR